MCRRSSVRCWTRRRRRRVSPQAGGMEWCCASASSMDRGPTMLRPPLASERPFTSRTRGMRLWLRSPYRAGSTTSAAMKNASRTSGSGESAGGLRGAEPPVEARTLARVARRAFLMDAGQEHVAVAVGTELLPVLGVAGRVPLAPELMPGPAPVDHPPLVERAVQRRAVGPSEHQDVAVLDILDDHRDQPLTVEGQSVEVDTFHQSLTGIPWAARCSLTPRIVRSPSCQREAARTASAWPSVSASAKCAGSPAPPDAITGTATPPAIARSRSRS